MLYSVDSCFDKATWSVVPLVNIKARSCLTSDARVVVLQGADRAPCQRRKLNDSSSFLSITIFTPNMKQPFTSKSRKERVPIDLIPLAQ